MVFTVTNWPACSIYADQKSLFGQDEERNKLILAKYVTTVHMDTQPGVANSLLSPNRIRKEEDRLKKNKERRQQREKQRGGGRSQTATAIGGGDAAMSPDAEPSIERGGTTRKCANCGQVGHIKTNKKYCPLYSS